MDNISTIAIQNDKINTTLHENVLSQLTTSLIFEDLNALTDWNLVYNSLSLKFLNLSCTMNGEYRIQINNDNKLQQTLLLEVLGKISTISGMMVSTCAVESRRLIEL